ncbi:hypothetical protein NFI96_031968, partial [Prochilodus magdalenae]
SCVSQSISPLEEKVDAVEGETVTLSCRYEYSGNPPYLHWYRQYPGSRPEFLLLTAETGGYPTKAENLDARMSIKVHKEEKKKVDLEISSAAVSDSALYYCALAPTVTGNPDTLYSGSVDYLYWYRQYPGSRPEFLLRIIPGSGRVYHATPPFPGLDAAVKGSVVDLKISSAAVSDSVLYYCALEPTVTRSPSTLYKNSLTDKALRCVWGFLSESCVSQSISPLEEKVDAVERQTVTLSCSYEGGGTGPSLHWYRQYPGSRPEFLLLIQEAGELVTKAKNLDARMSIKVHKEEKKKVDLEISSAAVSDSVLYYCALRPTVTGNPDTLRTQISPHYLNTGTTMMFLCSLSLFIIMIVHNHVLFSINAALLWFVYVFTESCVSQSISPLEEKVDAVEGETAALSCRYDGSADYLYWYHQYPGSRPEFLLRIDPSTKAVRRADPPFPRLDVKVNVNKLDLVISSSKISDSVLYYCALRPTVTRSPSTLYKNSLTDKALRCVWGFLSVHNHVLFSINAALMWFVYVFTESCVSQSISPLEEKVDAVEGETVTLSCRYEGSVYNLQWYRQYPGSRPEYLLMINPSTKGVSYANPRIPRLDGAVKGDVVDLEISSAAVSDSVLYYCALAPTVTGNPDTLYRNWFCD